jgi:hypothetical protein
VFEIYERNGREEGAGDGKPDGANSKKATTFTVKAVREYDRGTTKDGREWIKFLVITTTGEIIGTFMPEWEMFIRSTVTVPIKETMVNGKLYKSVEHPPATQPGAIARTTRMSPPPAAPKPGTQGLLLASEAQTMQMSIARIEAGLEQLLKRVDDLAAVQGDIAEGTRTITTLLRRRHPARDDAGAGGPPDEPDLDDPGPPDLPDHDDPQEAPDHA